MFEVISLKDRAGFKDGGVLSIGLPVILNALQNLFSQADPGHVAPDGRFIPGDLQSRLSYAANRISQYGVASVVDQTVIYDILTEVPPVAYSGGGNWQGNLDSYLGTLKTGLQNGSILPGQNQNPLIRQDDPRWTGGGFAYNFASFGNLLPLVLLGAGGYYLATHSKKKKRKK